MPLRSQNSPASPNQTAHWWDRISLGWVAGWLLVIVLLWWVLSAVSLSDVWRVLQNLTGAQIAVLLALNVLIAFTFGWRWWLVLRAQGFSIPYPILASYRLVCFSISYFTPGPHLGGEPLQVYLLHRRHGVPVPAATASVALDKLIEVLVNFTFLLLGVVITLQAQIAPGALNTEAVLLATLLLAIPVIFLGMLYTGRHPVSSLARRLPLRVRPQERFLDAIAETEDHAIQACREHPGAISLAVIGSAVVWIALFLEFWVATYFLGLNLTWVQLVSIITVARVSVLLPSPGGLGTLEAGQVIVMQWLGLDPAAGLGLSLLIRVRDVLFGIIGLLWGAWLIGSWQFLWGRQASE
jgi:uncharacterized protein (TIRG00374 family)